MEDEELISAILYRGEGTTLDLKRSQYPFATATDEDKSELLKDILAFANAWRNDTAYVVIGVTERPTEVVGLDVEIDDARVQQFVNAKTNRPVEFSYREAAFAGKRIGIYAIAVQPRPTFVRRPYGKVAANTVYVRRGSSTAIADPDEIARMGSASAERPAMPEIEWRVRDWCGTEDPDGCLLGHYTHWTFPSRSVRSGGKREPDFADYNPEQPIYGISVANRDFYRELADHMRASAGCLRFRLEIDNVGHAVADDLRILMVFPRTAGFKLIPETDLPKRPASHVDLFVPSRFVADRSRYDRIEVSSAEEGQTTVSIKLGKLHAGASLLTKYLYLTLPPTSPFTAQVGIYCDQFSARSEERRVGKEC